MTSFHRDKKQGDTDEWLDLYQLLGALPDSDGETLRKRLREAYSEAIANIDHRVMERRLHFQQMSERIIPQSRRILLDDKLRALYDAERTLHQTGDARARSFAAFLASISIAPERVLGDGDIPEQNPAVVTGAATSSVSEGFVNEEWEDDFEAVETRGETRGASQSETQSAAPNPAVETPQALAESNPQTSATAPVNPQPKAEAATPRTAPPKTEEPSATAQEPAQQSAQEPAALYASVLHADGPQIEAHSTAKLNVEESAATAGARRRRNEGATRISLGENDLSRRAVGGQGGRGKRVLSHTTQMLAMGIVAALLTIYIMRGQQQNAAPQIPLRIACASDLQPFMELAQKQFAQTEAGKEIALELRPVDSRAAMGAILSGSMPADVWIPAESLWSDRFNQVVGQYKKVRPISIARSVALSPAVLIARSDRAAALRRRFPNGVISSWSALRQAVAKDAPSHFGLTDPTYSGAGAIARYFMAREWCRANRVPWDKNAARNPQLWQWLRGFEDNVPASARLSADMTKELALGTADRYWWAIAYESEAIAWLQKGKKLDIFYLPQTTYADHPLCAIEREGEKNSGARAVFEQFLRAEAMQKTLLQTGLRPTEIEVGTVVPNNPFTDAGFRARGLKQSGFPTDSRINYDILNALNAAWSSRSG